MLSSCNLENIERIFAISDLHIDNFENLSWLKSMVKEGVAAHDAAAAATTTMTSAKIEKVSTSSSSSIPFPGPRDALIVAGDVSHLLSRLEEVFRLIIGDDDDTHERGLGCHVFFVPGNHEAWLGGQEIDELGYSDSINKLDAVRDLCDRMGVITSHRLVGGGGGRERCCDTNNMYHNDDDNDNDNDNDGDSDNGKNQGLNSGINRDNFHRHPVWIAPLLGWYDGSLSLGEDCADLYDGFEHWPWVDFRRCIWPSLEQYHCKNDIQGSKEKVANFNVIPNIPVGLTEMMLERNEVCVKEIRGSYLEFLEKESISTLVSTSTSTSTSTLTPPGLITFTHFLPNRQTLPDWKDPSSDVFLREEWLDHPVPDISAKFAMVAGSSLIDDQLRSIVPSDLLYPRRYYQPSSSSPSLSPSSFLRLSDGHDNDDTAANDTTTHTSLDNYSNNHAIIVQDVNDNNDDKLSSLVRHIHVFGHSHRPKDIIRENVRYVHNPLGSPSEREMNLVSRNVGFQLIWDCRPSSHQSSLTSLTSSSGEVGGECIVRYWEEKGGGKERLARSMTRRRCRKKIQVKRALAKLKLRGDSK